MAESSTVEKQDSLEDSLSSEDWTIIYNKECKDKDSTKKTKANDKKSDEDKENVDTETSNEPKENAKTEKEVVESGEKALEKEVESDDVSILSDDSELEHIAFEERRIERIEWQLERKPSVESRALAPKPPSNGNSTLATLFTCSMAVLALAIILAGRIEFGGDKQSSLINTEIEEKLKELADIKEQLKEFDNVKQALEQFQVNMPEIQKLKDQLMNQKYEKEKPKYLIDNFKNLNIENILIFNTYNNRLEMLGATYKNLCSTINKINSSSLIIENELCKTPKTLLDMILFKKNLKRAFEQTANIVSPEKRIFIDLERKLDSASESLLSEFITVFSRFSSRMQVRLDKFGYKLNKRLCFLNNNGKTNDKFVNILLDNEFFVNNCNDSSNSNPIVMDSKLHVSYKEEKNDGNKKRYEEFRKDNYKCDYKNGKDYKKNEDSKEDFSREVEYNKDYSAKSKGELKNDNNWKKNKYENKEKHYQEDKKYNKHEKFDNNNNNDFNKKNSAEHDFDSSFQNHKKDHQYNNKFENNKRDYGHDHKSEHNKKDHDYKFEHHKKDHDYDNKFEHKKDHDYENKFETHKKNYDNDRKFEYNKDHDHDQKFDHYKKDHEHHHKYDDHEKDRDFEHKFENKRNSNYDDDNSKFIINVENDEDQQPRYKEYLSSPDSYKNSKYPKQKGNDCRDKKEKYQPSGEWQMQRGKAREKLRNSDWYFVRADLRQEARMHGFDDKTTARKPQPPPSSRRKQRDDFDSPTPKKEHFSKRVMRKIGRTWDFLNVKFQKYL